MSHKLLVKDQQGEREVLLIDTVEVGRDPRCDISFADPLLSRRHAEFVASGEGVIVRDLNSRNGIRINGRRLPEAVLRPGDVVQIAQLVVTFLSTVDAVTMEAPRVVRASPDDHADSSGTTVRSAAAETEDDKTSLLTRTEIAAVAAASASRRDAATESGAPTNGSRRPGAWSVNVVVEDDRTNVVSQPGAPPSDEDVAQPSSPAPYADVPAAAPGAQSGTVVDDSQAAAAVLSAREPTPEAAVMTSGLAAGIVALAVLCFSVGVASTMIWLRPPLSAHWLLVDRAPVAVVVSFVLAVGAGVGLVAAARKAVRRT